MKDASGEVVELRCAHDPASRGGNSPDGRKVQATLHWVGARDAIDAEVRLYDHLFANPAPGAGDYEKHLNPNSLVALKNCKLEPALASLPAGEVAQFERQGYFCVDRESAPRAPVFNRAVGLRDMWAKAQAKG